METRNVGPVSHPSKLSTGFCNARARTKTIAATNTPAALRWQPKLTAKPTDSLGIERTATDGVPSLTCTAGRQRTPTDAVATTTDQKVGCSSHPERAEETAGQRQLPCYRRFRLTSETAKLTAKLRWSSPHFDLGTLGLPFVVVCIEPALGRTDHEVVIEIPLLPADDSQRVLSL